MKNTNSATPFDSAIKPLIPHIRQALQKIPPEIKENVQEIRIRSCRAVSLQTADKILFVTKGGEVSSSYDEKSLIANQNEVMNSFHSICNYSLYSHQNEIKNGFVTINGGHRIGVAGTAVVNESKMTGIRDISSLNIRVAREIIGSANELLFKLDWNLNGILIAGKPSCGKTTILRDIARQLSYKMKVCVLDERGELGAVCGGVSQNDLGLSDILSGYPKGLGILQAIRCLSPNIIICDEIGSQEETLAVEQGLNAGVGIIASVHCSNMEELRRRPQIKRLLATDAFHKVVLMGNSKTPGNIIGIYKIGDNFV